MLQESANDLNVFGNESTIDAARTMFEKSYSDARFPFKINYIILNSEDNFNIGDLAITVVNAIYPIPTLSCIIRNEGKLVLLKEARRVFVDMFLFHVTEAFM